MHLKDYLTFQVGRGKASKKHYHLAFISYSHVYLALQRLTKIYTEKSKWHNWGRTRCNWSYLPGHWPGATPARTRMKEAHAFEEGNHLESKTKMQPLHLTFLML